MPDYIEVIIYPGSLTTSITTDTLPPGGVTGQFLVKLSNANYHVAWVSPDAIAIPAEPVNVAELLSLPSDSWFRARIFNTYDSPVLTYWDKVLKSSPSAASITANGDSILETDDGLAYAVRTAIIPQS